MYIPFDDDLTLTSSITKLKCLETLISMPLVFSEIFKIQLDDTFKMIQHYKNQFERIICNFYWIKAAQDKVITHRSACQNIDIIIK